MSPQSAYTGIIPARAGFTHDRRGEQRSRRDHPRSRGVYPLPFLRFWCRQGSSPLARGLRDPRGRHPRTRRIIPARAGFTSGTGSSITPSWDHPRSRGVYEDGVPTVVKGYGSSPLARGLLQASAEVAGPVGIIPARAGFTHRPGSTGSCTEDHPRSREVYNRMAEPYYEDEGSSPLARGLRGVQQHRLSSGRIIPARAGFTPGAGPAPITGRDHPRSRGVYGSADGRVPLALWIIPARAGFTSPSSWRRRATGDHPRSRGVYKTASAAATIAGGSSPLARGLRRRFVIE